MSDLPDLGGPVSVVLEAELRTKVREQGIVVWLDTHEHFTAFVDRLVARDREALPYEVRAFRGSFLELLLSLEAVAGGTERPLLLLHLPGFTEETVKLTPLLELYHARGVRYKKALRTLVTEAASGRVKPERIAAFLEQPALTLEGADLWLRAELCGSEGGGLAARLRTSKPQAVVDDLLSGGYVAGHLGDDHDAAALWEQLSVWIGLPGRWRDATHAGRDPRPEDVAFTAASWALCVEYVHDLARPPVSPLLQAAAALPPGVVGACRELARHLRDHHGEVYLRTADDAERLLADEVDAARARDLGRIDTFRFEEERVLTAALAALGAGDWDASADWARSRIEGGSFWLRDDPSRRSAWQLVEAGARLGQAIAAAGPRLAAATGLDAAVERYREVGAAVDRAHRHLEQRRLTLLYPQLPEFETLRARLDDLRGVWRAWADAWASDFNATCREHGFLGGASSQQRSLFDDVVRPLAQEPGLTAYFVVDALRYEMGEELYQALSETPATTSTLSARLAELPTVTEVGMNVLAPVASQGRLRPALADGRVSGFSTGEYRVHDPDSRKRAMQGRVGGAACPWLTLEEVVSPDSASLKRKLARARLVVVHSRELDDAGEKGMGPAVFDHVMQKLRAAWRLLREAGVRRFVITADHGFLLLDDSVARAQAHGRRVDPKRRHVFSTVAADHRGEIRVPLSELGYDGLDGHVMFPETIAVFESTRRATGFVHGGNSLQERLIPVLTLVHRAAAGGSTHSYSLATEVREDVAGLHCLRVTLEVPSAQLQIAWGGAEEVELALRALELDDVVVELVQVRDGATLRGGAILARVGAPFEVFFRLSGASDARVQVEVYHPSAEEDVRPARTTARFAVTAARSAPRPAPPTEDDATAPELRSGAASDDWLAQLPEGGVRQLFAHLAAHGAVTEVEAAHMLGGQRKMRRFANEFEELARRAPFAVRVDVVAGVKRYVREGAAV